MYGNSINGYCQLHLWGLAALSLLQLLVKLELSDALLHHLNAFGLVNFCAAQELLTKSGYISQNLYMKMLTF